MHSCCGNCSHYTRSSISQGHGKDSGMWDREAPTWVPVYIIPMSNSDLCGHSFCHDLVAQLRDIICSISWQMQMLSSSNLFWFVSPGLCESLSFPEVPVCAHFNGSHHDTCQTRYLNPLGCSVVIFLKIEVWQLVSEWLVILRACTDRHVVLSTATCEVPVGEEWWGMEAWRRHALWVGMQTALRGARGKEAPTLSPACGKQLLSFFSLLSCLSDQCTWRGGFKKFSENVSEIQAFGVKHGNPCCFFFPTVHFYDVFADLSQSTKFS